MGSEQGTILPMKKECLLRRCSVKRPKNPQNNNRGLKKMEVVAAISGEKGRAPDSYKRITKVH